MELTGEGDAEDIVDTSRLNLLGIKRWSRYTLISIGIMFFVLLFMSIAVLVQVE